MTNGHSQPSPIKVALVGEHPRPSMPIKNGVQAVVAYLTQALVSIPEIRLTVISPGDDVRRLERSDLPDRTIYFVPRPRRLGNLSMGLPDKLRVVELLKEIDPHIVHVHSHPQYPFLWSSPPWPTVTTVHGIVSKEAAYERERMDGFRRIPRLLLEALIFRKLQQVIAVSAYVQTTIRQRTRADIRIVENPVSTTFFEVIPRVAPGRVLFAGTLSRRKNLLDLLRAIDGIRPQAPNLELRVAGAFTEPSYAQEIRAFVAEKQMQKTVSFLGSLSEEKLLEEYATCQIVASATREESAGMIFQQAMAAGKPVAATRVGGVPGIVEDGQTGLLADSGDWQALGQAILSLLTNPDLRNRIGRKGRHDADQRFRPETVARQTFDIYRTLLNGHGLSNGN